MSTVPVSLDPPDTTGTLGHPGSAAQGPWGRGLVTSELDAGPAATEVVTCAVEHAAAEHALVLGLARPQGWFRLAGRRRRGAPDCGRPRLPVPEAAPTCASSRSSPTGAREHNDVDHNPARNGDADRVVPAEDRSREYGLWASGECRQGEQQQLLAVGDWYAGCTD
jgi:hypothetical protein